MKFLKENLLDQLRRPEFSVLYQDLSKRKISRNGFISRPDTGENFVFIVETGKVRIYRAYEDKEFNLGILGPGDLFSTHTGTFVQALADTQVLVTDVKTFRRHMLGHPEVAIAMVRVLGDILKTSFDIIDGLAFKDANSRLVSLLLNEGHQHGRQIASGGIEVSIGLSVEQIARLVGASRQTVSTLLNDLIRAGLLERQGTGQYLIPDPEALRAVGGAA